MAETFNVNRRRFFGAAAMSMAAAQLGAFTSASAQSDRRRFSIGRPHVVCLAQTR